MAKPPPYGPLTKKAAQAKIKSAENSKAFMAKAGRFSRARKEASAAWKKEQDRPRAVRETEQKAIYDRHLAPEDTSVHPLRNGGAIKRYVLGNSAGEPEKEIQKHIARMGRLGPNPYMCPTKQRIIQASHSGQGTVSTELSGRTPFHTASADKHPSVHPH